jgi:hypothetical protein
MANRVPEKLQEAKKVSGFLHRTFDTDAGVETLKWLGELCHEADQTFTPGQADVTNFKEGKRFVIDTIRRLLRTRVD